MKFQSFSASVMFLNIASCFYISGVQAQSVIITTEELPPYNYTDPATGNIIGTNTAKVRKMMDDTKLGYEIRMLPWARAYQSALDIKNVCVFTTVYTPARKDLFKWVLPLSQDEWVLVSYKKIDESMKTLDDVRKFKIGGYGADARTNFLVNNGFNVDVASDEMSNLRKIVAGRIDLMVHQRAVGDKTTNLVEVDGKKAELHPVLTFNVVDSGLACNKNMDDDLFQKILSSWNKIKSD
jgi:polar amino acid transport system substrate-binding protein